MNREFLYTLLDSMSVSGHEIGLQKKVIAHMQPHCHKILTDHTGNVICVLNPDAPFRVMLAAHIDEIGLIVTHIQEDGLVRVARAGGIPAGIYPGHQVVLHGDAGPIYGAVIHSDSTKKADLKDTDLTIDIGAENADQARQYIREGDPAHLNTSHQLLLGDKLCARAIDDRGGAFIILEALKRAKELGCTAGVYCATTVGEETTMRGAYWAGANICPQVAIAVDVTYAQDYPGTAPEESGNVRLGKGPVLCNGSISSRKVNSLLRTIAREADIPIQEEAFAGRTGTDADKLHVTGTGVITALVSLPLRYMHSGAEVCDLKDVEAAIELLARFLHRVSESCDFDPFH